GGEALEPPPVQIEVPGPGPTATRPTASHVAILDRNLFGAQLASDTPVADEIDESEPLTKTKLPLKLLGTAASNNPDLSRASVENQKSREALVVAVGHKFEGLKRVRVKGIERARIILDNAGKLEELALYEDDGKQPKPRARKTPRQARRRPPQPKDTLNDRLARLNGEDGQGISRLLSSARIVPHYDPQDGSMLGMKVDAIKEGSLFEQVGLQNGDIITEVNGVVVDRLEATSRIMNELSTADDLVLAYERNGEVFSFEGSSEELMGN
ncbi:MAG: type II secretion system protein N, partial [Myxococcota bacterium]